MNAVRDMLDRLVQTNGAIVCSSACSPMELAFARKEGRFFVDANNYGYVVRLPEWRTNAESALKDNTAVELICAGCGEDSTNPGQFMDDGRWVCSNACKTEVLVCLSMNDGIPQD